MNDSQQYDISPPRPDEDQALDDALARSLHFPGGTPDWIERLGRAAFRVVRVDGRVAAGVALAPAGMWLGGQRIGCTLVNGVGVAPDFRGTGVGRAMMAAVVRELHAANVPLAALYPATLTFYRRAGFERAGSRITYELPLEAIDARASGLSVEPFGPARYDEVRAIYTQRAHSSAGCLDRPDWLWTARLEPPNAAPHRFLITRGDQTEGYVVYTQGSRSEPLKIVDWCALTPDAARRILQLLAGYRSVIEHVIWNGGPHDQLLNLLGESHVGGMRLRHRVTHHFDWMLRICDVAGALAARGYPVGINAEIHFDLADELLAANNGRFVLRVADGRGTVVRGGGGRVRLHIRELAALYTGFMAPAEVREIGVLDGPAAELGLLGALFSGPRPWIGDMF